MVFLAAALMVASFVGGGIYLVMNGHELLALLLFVFAGCIQVRSKSDDE